MNPIENITQLIASINSMNRHPIPDYVINCIKNKGPTITGVDYQHLLKNIEHNLSEYYDSLSLEVLRFSHLPINWLPPEAHANDINSQLILRANATKCLAKDGIAIYMVFDREKNLRLNMEDLRGRITPLIRVEKPSIYSGNAELPNHQQPCEIKAVILDEQSKFAYYVHEKMASKIIAALKNTVWFNSRDNIGLNLHEVDSLVLNDRKVAPIPIGAPNIRINEQLKHQDRELVDYLCNTASYGPTRKTIRKIVKDSLLMKAANPETPRSDIIIQALSEHLKGKQWFDPTRIANRSALSDINKAPELNDSMFNFATESILASGALMNPNAPSTRRHLSIDPTDPDAKLGNRPTGKPKTDNAAKAAPQNNAPNTTTTPPGTQKNSTPKSKNNGSKSEAKYNSTQEKATKAADEVGRVCQVFTDNKDKVKDIFSLTSLLINEITDGVLLPLSLDDINALNGIVGGMLQFPEQRDLGATWLSNIIHERQLALLQRNEIKPTAQAPTNRTSTYRPS